MSSSSEDTNPYAPPGTADDGQDPEPVDRAERGVVGCGALFLLALALGPFLVPGYVGPESPHETRLSWILASLVWVLAFFVSLGRGYGWLRVVIALSVGVAAISTLA